MEGWINGYTRKEKKRMTTLRWLIRKAGGSLPHTDHLPSPLPILVTLSPLEEAPEAVMVSLAWAVFSAIIATTLAAAAGMRSVSGLASFTAKKAAISAFMGGHIWDVGSAMPTARQAAKVRVETMNLMVFCG